MSEDVDSRLTDEIEIQEYIKAKKNQVLISLEEEGFVKQSITDEYDDFGKIIQLNNRESLVSVRIRKSIHYINISCHEVKTSWLFLTKYIFRPKKDEHLFVNYLEYCINIINNRNLLDQVQKANPKFKCSGADCLPDNLERCNIMIYIEGVNSAMKGGSTQNFDLKLSLLPSQLYEYTQKHGLVFPDIQH